MISRKKSIETPTSLTSLESLLEPLPLLINSIFALFLVDLLIAEFGRISGSSGFLRIFRNREDVPETDAILLSGWAFDDCATAGVEGLDCGSISVFRLQI